MPTGSLEWLDIVLSGASSDMEYTRLSFDSKVEATTYPDTPEGQQQQEADQQRRSDYYQVDHLIDHIYAPIDQASAPINIPQVLRELADNREQYQAEYAGLSPFGKKLFDEAMKDFNGAYAQAWNAAGMGSYYDYGEDILPMSTLDTGEARLLKERLVDDLRHTGNDLLEMGGISRDVYIETDNLIGKVTDAMYDDKSITLEDRLNMLKDNRAALLEAYNAASPEAQHAFDIVMIDFSKTVAEASKVSGVEMPDPFLPTKEQSNMLRAIEAARGHIPQLALECMEVQLHDLRPQVNNSGLETSTSSVGLNGQ